MTALWPTRRSVGVASMSLEGRASRFHCDPAHGRNRRFFLLAAAYGEGLFTEPIAGAQPWRPEPSFVSRSFRSAVPTAGSGALILHRGPCRAAPLPVAPSARGDRGPR